MPLYDYKCEKHGIFHELVPMNESGHAQNCPSCGNVCARVIILSSNLPPMDQAQKKAHARNEKSAHEPVFSTTESRDEKHGSGCGCEKPNERRSKMLYLADGSKIFPSQRPWMICH